ncbi:LacI family DNA-binding transcriptional regulator [Streptomyces sp. NBC_00490]|uniref:LacI family DNA-binding transcriptional regulator n=1 Tax=Streptomyces sp. NBC_00490 TaxID=2903657 RepID=UPI002E190D84
MATIQGVAKAAGVSAMTVSNVINDHPNVRRATREKVLEAMARLDYRGNLAARNLRKGRTGIIGLAVPGVNSAYYGELAAAIVAAAVRYDLRVSIEQTGALRENELAALSDMSILRHTGYRQALEDAGLRVDPALTQSMEAFTMRAGAQRAREMVESGLGFDGASA